VSNDNVIQLIQPGIFDDQLTDDQLTEVLRDGARALLAKAALLIAMIKPGDRVQQEDLRRRRSLDRCRWYVNFRRAGDRDVADKDCRDHIMQIFVRQVERGFNLTCGVTQKRGDLSSFEAE
jgi:hypothetical protein